MLTGLPNRLLYGAQTLTRPCSIATDCLWAQSPAAPTPVKRKGTPALTTILVVYSSALTTVLATFTLAGPAAAGSPRLTKSLLRPTGPEPPNTRGRLPVRLAEVQEHFQELARVWPPSTTGSMSCWT